MKIAMGVPDALDGQSWNGFRTAFNDLRRALSSHEVTVYSPGGGDVRLGGEAAGIPYPMSQYHNTLALSRDFASRVDNPDRIIAFNSMGLFLDRDFIYYSSNVPYRKVAEIAGTRYPDTPRFRKLLEYYRFVADHEGENYHKAGRIIVLSVKIRELMHELYGVEREKIRYIPRPIPPLENLAPARSGGGSLKLIFMPAEMRVMKGIRDAIEAMTILKERVPEAVLVICGRVNAYEKDYVSGLLRGAKGKANIILAGFPPRERYLSLMAGSDCAFMPFCYDECPVSLTECIGAGIPLVTNEYAGYPPEELAMAAHLARHNDPEDYARGLERMLTDEGYREGKSRGASVMAKRFTFDRYKEGICDAVES